jgi:hypothetical protein
MRYYDISLTPKGSTTPISVWSSHPNGTYDPAAPNVDFDMPVLPYGTPSGGQTVTIEGVSLQMVSQAKQLAGMNLTIKGGMQKGLPLANPAQAGVIIAGNIFQALGNWEGTEMSLDFVLYPAVFDYDNPGNFSFSWKSGQSLSDALKATLSIVYPDIPISISIGSNLVLGNDETHVCHTLDEFASYIGDLTEGALNQRVSITIQAGKIFVYDKTYQPPPIQIVFTDLIGQPTWIEPNIMQMKTVMRADLQLGSIITMPRGMKNAPGFVNTTAASLPSSQKYQSTFQNNFLITELRQIGSYRSQDAASWSTVFNCTPVS